MRVVIEAKRHKRITPSDEKLAAPLKEIAHYLADAIQARQARGMGATGLNEPYRGTSTGRVWVAPRKPQPQPEKYRIKAGPLKGWAVYPSLEVLARLNGQEPKRPGAPRTFEKTEELWRQRFLVYHASPRHFKLYFRGTHKGSGMRAPDLIRLIQKHSPGILEPSRAELAEARRMFAEAITGQVREMLGLAERGFRLRSGIASTRRRLARR